MPVIAAPAVPSMTFAAFVDGDWQVYVSNRDLKPSTRYSYDSMLKTHILPVIGDRPLRAITPEDLTGFFQHLADNKVAGKTRVNLYGLLKPIFDLAVDLDHLDKSPLRKKLHRPRLRGGSKKVALTEDELNRFLVEVPEEWLPLFYLLALTGMRAGELFALRWQDVDLKEQKIQIMYNLWRNQLVSPKTEGSRRRLHLPASLVEVLRSHRVQSEFSSDADFVFSKPDGSHCDPNEIRKEVLYPTLRGIGIQIKPRCHGYHMFRHTAATILNRQTGNLKLAQLQLGHTQLSTTANLYTHTNEEDAKTAAEALAGVIFCPPVCPPACPPFAHPGELVN